ncbi:unnamed protein product [Cladocopium goreaui]|uniref:peptidylprolyl isomerase n=1 Tax=Cladocopium goreaui TaxID=2562237 RepID=A0A9P1FYN5_9DINO|nr:unnamed protein product [Cladocopium goreaui]
MKHCGVARLVLLAAVSYGASFVGPGHDMRACRSRTRIARGSASYIPGFGLLSKETAVVSLDPGPLGLEVDAPTGVVQQVFQGGAGEKAGVRPGYVFQTLQGSDAYDISKLKALTKGEEPYEVTFGMVKGNPVAVMETSMGEIEAEIFLDRVPRTASNFIDLAKTGFYDGVHFHRVIPNFMVQFGCPNARDPFSPYAGTGGPEDGSFTNLATNQPEKRFNGGNIQDEFISDDSNSAGTLSMANTGQANSGGSQFFINVKDNTFLDWFSRGESRHPVFGKVIKGYDTAVKISKVYSQQDRPVEPIMMKSITIRGL